MLCVIAFCNKDARAAANLLTWVRELEGGQIPSRHRLLLVAAADTTPELFEIVKGAAVGAFSTCEQVRTSRVDNRPWPMGPNMMFKSAATFIAKTMKCPFWWNEPDCIPIVQGWLDALSEHYAVCGKPFMGAIAPLPRPHLTGCAVYPANIAKYNRQILLADRIAWDGVNPDATLRFTQSTPLLQHKWLADNGGLPTFATESALSQLRPDAVLFHRNKDHTLIERLREVRARTKQEVEQNAEQPAKCSTRNIIVEPTPAKREEVFLLDKPAAVSEICTYYQPINGFEPAEDLIALWKQAWIGQGWNPVVLNENDARLSSDYKAYSRAIIKLPTFNDHYYERACYMRHLAMAVRGGGFLTDYDVLPVKFTPADAEKIWANMTAKNRNVTFLEPTRVPCAVMATRKGYEKIVHVISEYSPDGDDVYQGKPHVSDMTILRKRKMLTTSDCVEYGCSGEPIRDHPGEGWKRASMIHFATASLARAGKQGDKIDIIRGVLQEFKPSNLLVIMCRASEDDRCRAFLPYWRKSGCDLLFSSPIDAPSTLPGVQHVNFGLQYDRARPGTFWRYQSRVLDTMKFCLSLPYEGFIFTQYDSVCLKPIPKIEINDSVHHWFRNGDPSFRASFFVHPPWCFGKYALVDFVRAAEAYDIQTTENGYMDRWMAQILDEKCPGFKKCTWSFSANAIDTPELIESAREAVSNGAIFIHGCKSEQKLQAILSP